MAGVLLDIGLVVTPLCGGMIVSLHIFLFLILYVFNFETLGQLWRICASASCKIIDWGNSLSPALCQVIIWGNVGLLPIEPEGINFFDIWTLYCACDYLSMLGLKLIHVSKRGHGRANKPMHFCVYRIPLARESTLYWPVQYFPFQSSLCWDSHLSIPSCLYAGLASHVRYPW